MCVSQSIKVSDLFPAQWAGVVALANPGFDALGMIKVAFVANKRCHLLVVSEVHPAYRTLGLNNTELSTLEFCSAQLTQDLRNGQWNLHKSPDKSLTEHIIRIPSIPLIDSMLDQLVYQEGGEWHTA